MGWLDGRGGEAKLCDPTPVWRNWQTRCLQVAVLAIEYRFDSCHGHQKTPLIGGVFLWVIGVGALIQRVGSGVGVEGPVFAALDGLDEFAVGEDGFESQHFLGLFDEVDVSIPEGDAVSAEFF